MNLPLSGDDAVLPAAARRLTDRESSSGAGGKLLAGPRSSWQGVTRAYARRLRNLHDGCGVLVPVSRTECPQSLTTDVVSLKPRL